MRRIVLVAVLAGLPATGCDPQECTLIGCGPTFRVDFQRMVWTPGKYRIEVVADGEALACTAELPLDCAAAVACPDTSRLILGLDGCALDPSEHKVASLEFQEAFAPKEVEVRVFQDDEPLGEGAYTPTYTESFPNGPECGPGCPGAAAAMLVLND